MRNEKEGVFVNNIKKSISVTLYRVSHHFEGNEVAILGFNDFVKVGCINEVIKHFFPVLLIAVLQACLNCSRSVSLNNNLVHNISKLLKNISNYCLFLSLGFRFSPEVEYVPFYLAESECSLFAVSNCAVLCYL